MNPFPTSRIPHLASRISCPTGQLTIITPEGHPAIDYAVGRLSECTAARGIAVTRLPKASPFPPVRPGMLRVLAQIDGAGLPPQSFSITRGAEDVVLVRGADPTGLAYGLHEVAAKMTCGSPQDSPMACMDPVECQPYLATRSVNQFLHNRELEQEWFYSADYWERFFSLMSLSRLNCFALTYAHQTAYLAPPFPFLVEVPGYAHVRTPGFSASDRGAHLAAVQQISSRAAAWGIRFVFGVWLQHAHEFGKSQVEGLSYDDLFDYCPKALALLLGHCPGIVGLQFRMNREAGIEEEDQPRFFGNMLRAVRECRDTLWVDLRAKGIREESVRVANELGFEVTVSTKFWTEHMGLPFFMTQTMPVDSGRRYGYWDLLHKGRPYNMLYRLWTMGSNKLLSWGDADYARRFAECCALGEGTGFEICAPLSNKGFGNHAGGNWPIITDPAMRHYEWECERYWPLLMTFGLQGYAPGEQQPVYEAEFARRFGPEPGRVLRKGLQQASRVIPWLVACHLPSPSTFGYWPEMYAGGSSDVYSTVRPSEWLRIHSIEGYVADCLGAERRPQVTPEEVADHFEQMALAAEAALQDKASNEEHRLIQIDIGVLAAMARYHAARFRSGLHYVLFRKTGDPTAIGRCTDLFEEALEHWRRIVSLTDGVYYDHMVFNRPPDQMGHWKDELPFLEHELTRLQRICELAEANCGAPEDGDSAAGDWYEVPMEWREDGGVLIRWAGDPVPSQPLDGPDGVRAAHMGYTIGNRYVMERPESLVQRVPYPAEPLPLLPSRVGRDAPRIETRDVEACKAGEDVVVSARIQSSGGPVSVRLHYRRMHQAEDWHVGEMQGEGEDRFSATIPGEAIDPQWNLMYAISAVAPSGASAFYPDMDERAPYVVVRVT